MKGINKIILFSLMVLLILTGCTQNETQEPTPESTTAEAPEAIEGEQEEETTLRVIAGTVASAEILDLIEVDVVGVVSTEKVLPERYQGIPAVGLPMNPDLEKVVSLDPELYITDASLKESIEALFQGQEIETLFLSNNSFEDLLKNIESLGEYFGKTEVAKAVVEEIETREQAVLAAIADQEAPNVLVIFGTPESFMLATKHSYTGGLVDKLGGVNVSDSLEQGGPVPYLPFSIETIAELNPDVILRLTHASPEASRAAFDKEFEKGFWVNLDAVKNQRVYDLDPEYFGVTGNVRAIEALEQMAEILYQ